LDAIQNDRDGWVETGFLWQTRKLFEPFWAAEDESTILEDHSQRDNIAFQLLKQLIMSGNKDFDELLNSSGKLDGVMSAWKILDECNMNWRTFNYIFVYGPWDMADEIGKSSLADTTHRNSWGTNKEFVMAAAVLGGKDVVATKLQVKGTHYAAYEVLPNSLTFTPLVFTNDGYHTQNHEIRAKYWKREQKFFMHKNSDQFDKVIKTAGKSDCPIIDVCVASSAAIGWLTSPDRVASFFEAYPDNEKVADVSREQDVEVPVPDEATYGAPKSAGGYLPKAFTSQTRQREE